MLGLLGKKRGMTQIFDEKGDLIPVTVLEVGPCTVVQIKTKEKEGYTALQLGYGVKKLSRATKPYKGHFEKKKLAVFQKIKEFRAANVADFQSGDVLTVASFQQGDVVDVVGVTKGRGFAGVMKRHGKHGGPDGHGSDFHRGPGSIGMRAWPGRVLKNMKLPGHYGCDRVTTQNLKVIRVMLEENLLLVEGSVPGFSGGDIMVMSRKHKFEKKKVETDASSSVEQGQ